MKMTDKESGKETPEKTVVEISIEDIMQENLELKARADSLQKHFETATKKYNKANSLLEQDARSKVRDELRGMGCTYGVEEFGRMSIAELKQLKQHYKAFQPPSFQSGADVSGKSGSIYDAFDDLYVPLDKRMKSLQEA